MDSESEKFESDLASLGITLEEFTDRYLKPFIEAYWAKGADEFDRGTCTMINEQADT